jgi:hypothetical protein
MKAIMIFAALSVGLLSVEAIFAQPQSPNFMITREAFSAGANFDSSAHFSLFSSVCQWSVADTHISTNYRLTSGFLAPSYGTATGAFLVANPPAVNFGNVHIDSSLSRTITLSDTGFWNLLITSMQLRTGTTFQFAAPLDLPDTIYARNSREYSIRFNPAAPGLYRDTLTIAHDAGNPVVIPIEATGIAPAITVNPDTILFGDLWIGRAVQDTFTILNPGSADLRVDSIVSSHPAFSPQNAVFVVAPGSRRDVPITVSLPDTLHYSGLLTIHSNAGEPTIFLSAHGTWTALRAFPAAISIDSIMVGDSITVTDTLWSIGNRNITLQLVHLTTYNFDIVQAPVNNIPAYGQTTLAVIFRAAHPGVFEDTLVIVNDLGTDLRVPLRARGTSSTGEQTGLIPKDFFLDQNYPNPFNPSTTIRFGVPKTSNVTINIFNLLGRSVATVLSGTVQPGMHAVVWNCSTCPSGMYLIRMQANDRVFIRKMLLMK